MKLTRKLTILLFFAASTLLSIDVFAEVKLASLFTDNMVLQQQSDVAIWGWANANSTVTITPSWSKKRYTTKADASGKWKIKIATPAAGSSTYNITFTDGKEIRLQNVLIGDVWLCTGQSNMEMPMKGFKGQPLNGSNDAILHSKNSHIRVYTVPRWSVTTPQENGKSSDWEEATPASIAEFSATGYYFGKLINELTGIPIGLINCSYGGSTAEAWMNAETLKEFTGIQIPKKDDEIKVVSRTPTTLYNGMLHPVIGYGIKGIIWYQGESNYSEPDLYEKLFPAMVGQWRKEWNTNDTIPFYYAQIAPYNYAQLAPFNRGGKYNSAFLRDAQRKALDKISHSGMAVLVDIGEENNIHPQDKETGGKRLALLALGNTYNMKGFAYQSPQFDTMTITGSTVEVKFRDAPQWLTSYGKDLKTFEIAGKDKKFYPATAVIYRNTVLVSAPQVKEPVAVRYAFQDFIKGDLFGSEGLPVSSFRTDDW